MARPECPDYLAANQPPNGHWGPVHRSLCPLIIPATLLRDVRPGMLRVEDDDDESWASWKWESPGARELIRINAWLQTNETKNNDLWGGIHVKICRTCWCSTHFTFVWESARLAAQSALDDDKFETPVQLPTLSINRATQPLWPTLIRWRTLGLEPERKLTKLKSGQLNGLH